VRTYAAGKSTKIPEEVDPIGWAFLGNRVEVVPQPFPDRIYQGCHFGIVSHTAISHPDLGQKGVAVAVPYTLLPGDTSAWGTTPFREPPSACAAAGVMAVRYV
jgi:hypothetical protein